MKLDYTVEKSTEYTIFVESDWIIAITSKNALPCDVFQEEFSKNNLISF